MIKSMMKFRLLFVLALVFQLVTVPLHSLAAETDTTAPTWISPINYLALGDSLAFGVGPQNEVGNGYPDFLAQSIGTLNLLKSFNKGFAAPGYKTEDVLQDLQMNPKKPVLGSGKEGEIAELHKSIAEANLITISVGANDVIAHIDKTTGTIDLVNITASIKQVGVNYNMMLKAIYEINPNVQLYIMGYYNSFPYYPEELQPQLGQLLTILNGAIQAGMEGTNAVFIPTADKIAEDYKAYLPNPTNIHLSEAGYQLVAELFGVQLKEQLAPKDLLIAEVLDKTSVELNWKPAQDNVGVVAYVIYNGKEEIGTAAGNVNTYEVTDLEDNKAYTFSVVAVDGAKNPSLVNPSVQVTLGTPLPIFPDIENSHFKVFIEQATALGLIKGYENGNFGPNDYLTRVQAAAIIVRGLGLKADAAAPFTDISNTTAETQAEIAAAYQFGIVKGSNGKFNPSEPVTRAQLALMLKRTYELATGKPYVATDLAPFSDIGNLDAETQNAITFLYTFEVANGSDGKYMPNDSTKRGQAAKMFVNFYSLMK